jgi:hypothetical protein
MTLKLGQRPRETTSSAVKAQTDYGRRAADDPGGLRRAKLLPRDQAQHFLVRTR